jgi:hypothetical protein
VHLKAMIVRTCRLRLTEFGTELGGRNGGSVEIHLGTSSSEFGARDGASLEIHLDGRKVRI